MIATDKFVFLHLHKSGGSFVNEFLLRFVPGARAIGYHLPRLLIPRESLQLPVLGFVRNPWSYYVTWYTFQSQRPRPNALYRILSDHGRLDFGGTLRNMLDLGAGSPLLDAVIASLPSSYGDRGLNLPQFALAPIRNSGLGFYSHLYRYLYGDPDRHLTVERSEELRSKLPDYLDRVGQRVTHAMQDFLTDTPPRNTSAHPPYAQFYTEDLRELVAARDRPVIESHGYRFCA